MNYLVVQKKTIYFWTDTWKKIHQIKREITQPVRTEFRFYASQNTTSNRSQWTSPALHHKAGINTMLIEVSYLYIVHVLYILIPKVYLAKSTYIYLQVFCLICPCIIFNVDLFLISKELSPFYKGKKYQVQTPSLVNVSHHLKALGTKGVSYFFPSHHAFPSDELHHDWPFHCAFVIITVPERLKTV